MQRNFFILQVAKQQSKKIYKLKKKDLKSSY